MSMTLGELRDDPEAQAVLRRVDDSYRAYTKAQAKVNRSRREDSLEAARKEMRRAEAEYRAASGARDEFVEIWRARQTQRADRQQTTHDKEGE